MKLEHLSASTLEAYETCPRRLYKRKVEDNRQTATIFTEIGRAVHETLEIYHTKGLEGHANLASLLDEVAKKYAPLDFGRFSDMRTLLKTYELENPLPSPTVAVEKQFLIEVGGFKVKGFIDRIDYLGDGVYEIIDYKTSFIKKKEEELQHDTQGVLYDIALRQMWENDEFPGLPRPEKVVFSLYFIRYGKVSVTYSDEERENAAAFVEYTGYRIEMDDGEPEARLNTYCRSCEYRGDCPLFMGGWEKYLDAEVYADLDSLIDLLDKFKHISKIVDSKIKELTQQIMQELSDKGEMEHVSQTGVKANIQSQARSYYMLDNIKVNLPEWYKYAVVDVKSVLENGTPEDIEIVNRYKATKRTSPFINTKQTKF